MKKLLGWLMMGCLVLVVSTPGGAQETPEPEGFYFSSLHATARGMEYWYDKANGGLETVTGIPYAQVGCAKCHVNSCDACHKREKDGKPIYSTAAARSQENCLRCHAREAHMIMKIDKAAGTTDVHVAKGMVCMDCHTAREIHGDGTPYKTMKAQGVMDVSCEQCHATVTPSVAHQVHGDKLDCKACHVRHVVSCNNCHFETMIKAQKRVALPVTGWKFLMNYNGKVTAANTQSFVLPGHKTFMLFAPQFSHSIMKEGSKCEACHATETVKKVMQGELTLSWLEDGKVQNIKGAIPVVDGVKYQNIYQDYVDGNWVPIENPVEPKVQYVGYGTPLTKEQLEKMNQVQTSAK